MFKKSTFLMTLALIITLGITGCGSEKGQNAASQAPNQSVEKIKLNVGYIPAVEDVLYFVAKEKGYFDQEGLDVELFSFNSSGEGVNAIRSGKLDVGGFGSSAAFTNVVKGLPLVNIGGVGDEGAALITKPENAERFKTTQGFKGAKVGTVRLSTGDVEWKSSLVKEGIDLKADLSIFELDSPAAVLEAVKKGSVDAGIVWVPFPEMAEQQGLKIVKWSDELEKGHICCRSLVLQDKLTNNKEALIRFNRALIRAYDYYIHNPNETVTYISKYVNINKELIQNATYSGHIHSNPDPNKKGYITYWNVLKAAGFFQNDLDVERYVDVDIYKTALTQLRQQEPQNATYIQLEQEFSKNDL